MTNYINNINDASIANTFFQTIEQHVIEKHLNKSEDVKLLVLKLDDLSADIINHLKEKKCNMMLLNNNFKIVERTDKKLIQLNINGVKQSVKIENIIHFEACGNYTYIHLENRLKPVLISRTLKYYVNLVPDSNFIRTIKKTDRVTSYGLFFLS